MDATISLSGNVGTDVEFTEGDGWAYARFRLACTPRFLRKGEWVDAETTWITVRTTNRAALNVRHSIRKGDPVVVTGRLRTHSWTNPEGERIDRLVVEATSLGHDLTRGITSFARIERSPQSPATPSEQDASAERDSTTDQPAASGGAAPEQQGADQQEA